jgi:AraC-like DNA-binding protein
MMNGFQPSETRKVFLDLGSQYMNRPPYYEIICSGLICILVYYFLETLPKRSASTAELQSMRGRYERLTRVIRYAEMNYARRISLAELARIEGLSLSYLSAFIKQNLHMSFQDYVGGIRYSHARQLLLTTDKSVLDVSLESGYSDPKYLAKAFSKNTGFSPAMFRKTFRDTGRLHLPERGASREYYYTRDEALEFLAKVSGSLLAL